MQQINPYSYNSNGITYPTALDLSGNLVSAVTAPKQARYTCLECEVNMAVCRGEVKRPHFRHLSESNVERLCNPESYIHKLAKRLLKEKLDLALRENTPFILKWRCTDCRKDFSVNLTDYIDQVEVEHPLFNNAVRPDLTLFKDGKPVITLEVVNTHAPEEKTLRLCEDNNVKVFVVPVSPQDNLVDDWQNDQVSGKWACHQDYLDNLFQDKNLYASPVGTQAEYVHKYLHLFLTPIVKNNLFHLCLSCSKNNVIGKLKQIHKEKEKEEKRFSLIKGNQDYLSNWDGEELILLLNVNTGAMLGLFRGTAVLGDDDNGDVYALFCDMSKIKISNILLWLKNELDSDSAFDGVTLEEELLSNVDIETKTKDRNVLAEKMPQYYEYKERKEKREKAISESIPFYSATKCLSSIKNSPTLDRKLLIISQNENITKPLTDQEIHTEETILNIWNEEYDARSIYTERWNILSVYSFFESIPFILAKGLNGILYAILGISKTSFPFCDSNIIYACDYRKLGPFLLMHKSFSNHSQRNLLLHPSFFSLYLHEGILIDKSFHPFFIRANIDNIVFSEINGENRRKVKETINYYMNHSGVPLKDFYKNIVAITARDIEVFPSALIKQFDMFNPFQSSLLQIKACVTYKEKDLAKNFGFTWDPDYIMWKTVLSKDQYLKYSYFFPFKTEILTDNSLKEYATNIPEAIRYSSRYSSFL